MGFSWQNGSKCSIRALLPGFWFSQKASLNLQSFHHFELFRTMPLLISASHMHFNVYFADWRLKEAHCTNTVFVCWLIDGTRAMRGHACHTFKKLKYVPFLALIILSEKISSTSQASHLIFLMLTLFSSWSIPFHSILQSSLVFSVRIDSVHQLLSPCLQFLSPLHSILQWSFQNSYHL